MYMILKFINPLVFFIALCVGFFIVYITAPKPEVIIKYPTPENAGRIIYKNKAEDCYKYKADKVKCPKDNKLISNNIDDDYNNENSNEEEKKGIFESIFKKK